MRRIILTLAVLGTALLPGAGCQQYLGYDMVRKQGGNLGGAASRKPQYVAQARYGEYDELNDLLNDPLAWVLGILSPVEALAEGNWRWLCYWPPVDLVARICGDGGFNDPRGPAMQRNRRYAVHPPGYFRRLAQWWGWVAPGYTLMAGPMDEPPPLNFQEMPALDRHFEGE